MKKLNMENGSFRDAAVRLCVFVFSAFLFAESVRRVASGSVVDGMGMMGFSAFLLFLLNAGSRPPEQGAA